MIKLGYRPLKINFKKAQYKLNKIKWLEWILIIIILFQVGFVFFQSFERPMVQMDAITNWGLKAKNIFLQNNNPYQFQFSQFKKIGAHISYPLHTSLLLAWSYFFTGQVSDSLVGAWFFIYFLAIILLLYSFLKRFLNRFYSLGLISFLSIIPIFVYHGFANYSDIVLGFYFTLASVFLYKFFKDKHNFNLLLAGIFSGFCIWTKNEGLFLALVLFLVFLYFKIFNKKRYFKKVSFKKVFYFLLPVIFISLPWLAFKFINKLGFNNLEKPLVLKGPYFKILPMLFHQIFVPSTFHIWPGIFLIGLIIFSFCKKKKPGFKFFNLVILITFLAYLFIYLFTHSYKFVLDGTIVGRNMLVLLPMTFIVFGIGFSKFLKEK